MPTSLVGRRCALLLAALVVIAPAASVDAQLADCNIEVRIGPSPEIGGLALELVYDPTRGRILGEAEDAVCMTPAIHDVGTYNHDPTTTSVAAAIVMLTPLVGPAPVLNCQFRAKDSLPDELVFQAAVVEAVAPPPSFEILPPPAASVHVGACESLVTTTTTTTTSTSLTSTSSTTTSTLPVTTTVVPVTTSTTSTTTTTLPVGKCGLLVSPGPDPTASDALAVLRAAVALVECPLCLCDVDASGRIAATDALIVLRAAVGLDDLRSCIGCI